MLSSSVVSNRKPSCGTITIRARSEPNRTSRRSTPSTSTRPSVGSISRVSSLANVVLPRAGLADDGDPGLRRRSRRRRRAARAGRRVGERHVLEAHVDRARAAARRRPRPGRRRRPAVSSTPSTRRQPATAFCASLSTSVPTWTGPTNSVTRNRNATSWPSVMSPSIAEQHADHDDRRRSRARRSTSPVENVSATIFCARVAACRCALDRGVDALGGAVLDAVRADDRRADDRLGRPRRASRRPARGPAL